MALEREILERIQSAPDEEQAQLYRALLGDLTFRKTQGLTDSEDQNNYGFVNLPQLLSPEDSSLVEKYRSIFGILGDSVSTLQAEAHFSIAHQFTRAERNLISLGFNRARRALRDRRPTWDREFSMESVTLGEVRRVSPEELVAQKMILIKRALIFLHAIQFSDQSNS